ncbi:hypothetical protein Tco_0913168 [Tanacetum coccineum]
MAVMICQKSLGYSNSPMIHVLRIGLASSNPLLFFDSPLPGVNTPWDVMRIVSQSASIVFVFLLLLDVALAAAHSQVSILKLISEDLSRNLKLTGSNSSLGEDC